MVQIRRRLNSRVSVSIFAVLAACPVVATAQEAVSTKPAETTTTEVVVIGTKASLRRAADVKKNSSQFVDSIVAADIGKLPDTNIAESLQRVSGVQIKRSLGEGTQVSIRGLTQNITLVNGREIVDSAGRGGSGIDTLGTGSYGLLAQLPSELIQRLDVTKLASAAEPDGALSGTVNILTPRPLDSKADAMAFSVEALANSREPKGGTRDSFLITHHFSPTLAGLLNVSYSNRNIRDESVFSFSGYLPMTGTGAPAQAYYLADMRDTQIDDNRKRLGVAGTLQWKPSSNLDLVYDLLYSKQDITRSRYWLALPLQANYALYTAPTFTSLNTLMSGTLSSALQTNSEYYTNTGDTVATGLSGAWHSGSWKVNGDLSYSKATQDGYQWFARLTTKAAYPVSFNFTGVDVPSFTVPATANLRDPAAFNFTNYFDNRDTAASEDKAARLDFVYSTKDGIVQAWKFGARATELDVTVNKYQSQLAGNVSADLVGDSYRARTLDILSGATGYSAVTALYPAFFDNGKKYAYDIHGYAAGTFTPYVFQPLASYATVEKTTSVYAQADLEAQVFGLTVAGNVGVRQVSTDFTANGALKIGSAAPTALVVTKHYADTLPSLSLRTEVADNLLIRFGAAKVIARPNSSDQNPGLSLAVVAPFVGSAGNPQLDPFRATQYDLSAEYYFKPGSLVSMGLFTKELGSFIIKKASTETYSGQDYIVTRPYNGANASLQGVEVFYQDNFSDLPAPFDGLGTQVGVSLIDSDSHNVSARTGEKIPVPGLSKTNLNIVLYYEKAGYSLRAAYNWRDRYLDSLGIGGEPVYFDKSDDLSLSARVQLNTNYSLDVQVSNALDSRTRKYGTEEPATLLYGLNGVTYSVALRGKF